jgi:hypothetical protein
VTITALADPPTIYNPTSAACPIARTSGSLKIKPRQSRSLPNIDGDALVHRPSEEAMKPFRNARVRAQKKLACQCSSQQRGGEHEENRL